MASPSLLFVLGQSLLHRAAILDLLDAPLLIADGGVLVRLPESRVVGYLLFAALPDVGAAGAARAVLVPLPAAVVVADGLLVAGARGGAVPHAEPEVIPVLAARPHRARPVDAVELAADALAVEGRVEGLPARHGRREERLGERVERWRAPRVVSLRGVSRGRAHVSRAGGYVI